MSLWSRVVAPVTLVCVAEVMSAAVMVLEKAVVPMDKVVGTVSVVAMSMVVVIIAMVMVVDVIQDTTHDPGLDSESKTRPTIHDPRED